MDNNLSDLPGWLKDTTAFKQAPPPPVAKEPELLPAPSPKVLIKPALIVAAIILVIATSVGAFFLTQKKEEKFVLEKKAVPLETITCSGGTKSEEINTTRGCTELCCPIGTANDQGGSSGTINITYGFGDARPCTAANGKTQTYSIEIIKCTNDDLNRCKYGAYSDYEKGERVTSSCHNLVVDDSGKGQIAYNYTLPGPGCYQFDICAAGPGQSCYLSEGGVVFGFRTAYGVQCKDEPTPTPTVPPACPYIFSVIGLNQTASVGDRPTIYVQAGSILDTPTVKVSKNGSKIEDLTLVPGSVSCSSGKCNHQFTPLASAFSIGTYTFDFMVKGVAVPCATRMVTVGSVEIAFCSGLTAFKEGSSPPSSANLKEGDLIRFVITPSGTVEAAVVRLFKNGVKVGDLSASIYEVSKWSATYTIPAGGAGNYEALGFVKVGSDWK